MENPVKIDDLEVPLFQETSISEHVCRCVNDSRYHQHDGTDSTKLRGIVATDHWIFFGDRTNKQIEAAVRQGLSQCWRFKKQ